MVSRISVLAMALVLASDFVASIVCVDGEGSAIDTSYRKESTVEKNLDADEEDVDKKDSDADERVIKNNSDADERVIKKGSLSEGVFIPEDEGDVGGLSKSDSDESNPVREVSPPKLEGAARVNVGNKMRSRSEGVFIDDVGGLSKRVDSVDQKESGTEGGIGKTVPSRSPFHSDLGVESSNEGVFVPEESKSVPKSTANDGKLKTEIADRLEKRAASLRREAKEMIRDALRLKGSGGVDKDGNMKDVDDKSESAVVPLKSANAKPGSSNDDEGIKAPVQTSKPSLEGEDKVEVGNDENGNLVSDESEEKVVDKVVPREKSLAGGDETVVEKIAKVMEGNDGGSSDSNGHNAMTCPTGLGPLEEDSDDWEECLHGCKGSPGLIKNTPYIRLGEDASPVKIIKKLQVVRGKSLYLTSVVNKGAIKSIEPLLKKAQSTFCDRRTPEDKGGDCIVVQKRYEVSLPEEEDLDRKTGLMKGDDFYCREMRKLTLEPTMGSDLTTRTLDGEKFGEGRKFVMPSLGYYLSLYYIEAEEEYTLYFNELWPYYINDNLKTYSRKTTKSYSSEQMSEYLNNVAYEGCLALAHAHEMGWIHRDVKPDNFFVDSQGRAILADFDLSTRLATESPDGKALETEWARQACVFIGTDGYLAPELLDDCDAAINAKTIATTKDVLFARDMWAFGKTLLTLSGESSLSNAVKRFGDNAPWLQVAGGMLKSDVSDRMTGALCTEVMRQWKSNNDKSM